MQHCRRQCKSQCIVQIAGRDGSRAESPEAAWGPGRDLSQQPEQEQLEQQLLGRQQQQQQQQLWWDLPSAGGPHLIGVRRHRQRRRDPTARGREGAAPPHRTVARRLSFVAFVSPLELHRLSVPFTHSVPFAAPLS